MKRNLDFATLYGVELLDEYDNTVHSCLDWALHFLSLLQLNEILFKCATACGFILLFSLSLAVLLGVLYC